jgi:hypothetical protein
MDPELPDNPTENSELANLCRNANASDPALNLNRAKTGPLYIDY